MTIRSSANGGFAARQVLSTTVVDCRFTPGAPHWMQLSEGIFWPSEPGRCANLACERQPALRKAIQQGRVAGGLQPHAAVTLMKGRGLGAQQPHGLAGH